MNAATGLKIANNGPNSEYEANIESAPVVGVDTKKLKVALLLAPSFFSDAAQGLHHKNKLAKEFRIKKPLLLY